MLTVATLQGRREEVGEGKKQKKKGIETNIQYIHFRFMQLTGYPATVDGDHGEKEEENTTKYIY